MFRRIFRGIPVTKCIIPVSSQCHLQQVANYNPKRLHLSLESYTQKLNYHTSHQHVRSQLGALLLQIT